MRKFPFLRLMILFGVIDKTVPIKLKLNLAIDIDPVNEIGTFLKQNKYLIYWVKGPHNCIITFFIIKTFLIVKPRYIESMVNLWNFNCAS